MWTWTFSFHDVTTNNRLGKLQAAPLWGKQLSAEKKIISPLRKCLIFYYFSLKGSYPHVVYISWLPLTLRVWCLLPAALIQIYISLKCCFNLKCVGYSELQWIYSQLQPWTSQKPDQIPTLWPPHSHRSCLGSGSAVGGRMTAIWQSTAMGRAPTVQKMSSLWMVSPAKEGGATAIMACVLRGLTSASGCMGPVGIPEAPASNGTLYKMMLFCVFLVIEIYTVRHVLTKTAAHVCLALYLLACIHM